MRKVENMKLSKFKLHSKSFDHVKSTLKTSGFKGLQKKYGWKLFAGVIAYYLIRDITFYLIIPYFIIDRA